MVVQGTSVNFTKPIWRGDQLNITFISDLFKKQTFFYSNIKRNKGVSAKDLVKPIGKRKSKLSPTWDLCLSKKILAFLSNQINLIKDKTITCQIVFPFGRVAKALKEIHHPSYAFRRNLYNIGYAKQSLPKFWCSGTMKKEMIDWFTILKTHNIMIWAESFVRPPRLKLVIGINLLISHKPSKSLNL